MHAVLVWFDVKPEHRNEFMSAMLTQAENSLQLEEGCHYFDVCTSEEQTDRVFLYELYNDAAAFQTHLDSDHFKAFAETVAPWISGRTIENWQRAYPAAS